MKRVVLAVAFTGLMCVAVLAGPTNDVGEPGHIPTSDVRPAPTPPPPPPPQSSTSTGSSVALVNVILAIVTLTNR